MLPIGHIAAALLANRAFGLDDDPLPSVAGALLPDAIDKTLSWVLGAIPTARHIGHTPLIAACLALASTRVVGRRRATAFGVAYAAHLVGDLTEGGHIPWLMPFRRCESTGERWHVHVSPLAATLELLGAAYIALLARSGRFDGDGAPVATPGEIAYTSE